MPVPAPMRRRVCAAADRRRPLVLRSVVGNHRDRTAARAEAWAIRSATITTKMSASQHGKASILFVSSPSRCTRRSKGFQLCSQKGSGISNRELLLRRISGVGGVLRSTEQVENAAWLTRGPASALSLGGIAATLPVSPDGTSCTGRHGARPVMFPSGDGPGSSESI